MFVGQQRLGGTPFIPYGLGWERIPSPAVIQSIAQAGFNTLLPGFRRATTWEQVQAVLTSATANGLRVIPCVAADVPEPTCRQWVARLKGHPALIAWAVYDEPVSDPQMAAARERYRIFRECDPSRPAYLSYTTYDGDDPGDLASMDYYPLPGALPCVVGADADILARGGKPVWYWMQGCGYAYMMRREPTGPEVEGMVYSFLIHGGRGLGYFAHQPHSKELWDTMARMAGEVVTLSPVLYSLETAPEVKSASPAASSRRQSSLRAVG